MSKIHYVPSELLEEIQKESILAYNFPILKYVNRSQKTDLSLLEYCGNWITGWTNDENWINFGLIYGSKILPDSYKFHNTMHFLLNQEPSVVMAGFSILKSNSSIPLHIDDNKSYGARSWHIGLDVPESCFLTVNDNKKKKKNGKVINFDDSLKHEAVNLSSKDRLILYYKTV